MVEHAEGVDGPNKKPTNDAVQAKESQPLETQIILVKPGVM